MRRICNVLVVVVIVLIGGSLVLSWIVQARHAAARERCRNNLRDIGLALENYHVFYGRFPSGCKPKEGVPPERRLSWLFEILPYLESRMDETWHRVDRSGTWDAEANRLIVDERYSPYLCPSNVKKPDPDAAGLSHYVGIAGVGEHAAFLPRDDSRAGVFGYENSLNQPKGRALGIRQQDIKDGLAKTMMVVETTWENGPWAAGGPSTVRGLDPNRQPYLGADRQFGGLHRRGSGLSWFADPVTNVLFADASVRSFTAALDSRIFEAMAT